MNIIMPTIPGVSLKNNGYQGVPQIQTNNFGGYSFSKQYSGLDSTLSVNTSLNNSATSIINAYFACFPQENRKNNKTNTKKDSIINKNTTINPSSSYFITSKPTYCHTNNKVTIQNFYYVASNNDKNSFNKDSTVFHNNFSELSSTLAQLYQKEVNVIATRLYYPYLNSDILSQYLAYNAPSNTFMDFQEAILTNPSLHKMDLPAHVSGIKVQVSGRLVTETVIPRITVKSCLIGSFGSSNTTQIIDYSKFTTKNELGAFTVKVWICQRS